MYDFDLFTIGGGSGGVRASRMAAQYGAKVALAEERYLGGTCVNVGCIPKKLFVYASHFSEAFADSAGFGWTLGERKFDWRTLIANKDLEIARLGEVYETVLADNGVRIFRERATIADAHTVVVGSRRYTARYILIATGGWPTIPNIPGRELAITSNEAFFLPQFPSRVVIVGGGYIGLEFGGIFHGLGAKVTVVHRGDMVLRGFDDDVRRTVALEMDKRGVEFRFKSQVERIEKLQRGICATLSDGTALEADLIMFATGRTPNTHNLGLEQAGVELNYERAVVVDRIPARRCPTSTRSATAPIECSLRRWRLPRARPSLKPYSTEIRGCQITKTYRPRFSASPRSAQWASPRPKRASVPCDRRIQNYLPAAQRQSRRSRRPQFSETGGRSRDRQSAGMSHGRNGRGGDHSGARSRLRCSGPKRSSTQQSVFTRLRPRSS